MTKIMSIKQISSINNAMALETNCNLQVTTGGIFAGTNN